MAELELHFSNFDSPNLIRVVYRPSLNERPQVSHRGGAGVYHPPYEPIFQWSAAVKALSILVLRTLAAGSERFELFGEAETPASSLDFAISKEPAWLLDMFGIGTDGKAEVKKLIGRVNTERRRPGPVRLWLDAARFSVGGIRIYCDNVEVVERDALNTIGSRIEASYRDGKLEPDSSIAHRLVRLVTRSDYRSGRTFRSRLSVIENISEHPVQCQRIHTTLVHRT